MFEDLVEISLDEPFTRSKHVLCVYAHLFYKDFKLCMACSFIPKKMLKIDLKNVVLHEAIINKICHLTFQEIQAGLLYQISKRRVQFCTCEFKKSKKKVENSRFRLFLVQI